MVTYTGYGNYAVTLYAYGSGAVDSTSTTVVVTPAITDSVVTTPATGATGSANGSATIIGLTGAAPLAFIWNDANSDTTETISDLTAGVYYFTIYSSAGCYLNDSAVVNFVSGIINIGGNKQANIFPNPASEILNVDFNTATTAEIRISDISGKVISVLSTENNVNNVINIHNLVPGNYIVTIVDKATKAEQSVKFVKL